MNIDMYLMRLAVVDFLQQVKGEALMPTTVNRNCLAELTEDEHMREMPT